MKTIKHICAAVLFLLLASSLIFVPASAAVSGPNLKVTLIEINPYPAKIGQYLELTVQVENIGRERAENVFIELVPDYPFSLDSPANSVQNVGALAPEKIATKEFYLFVDKNAQKGTRSIDVRTQTKKDAPWSETSFEIRIGSETFDSKGTVELEAIVSDPEVFMPGDRGTVTLTLRNTAETPTITIGEKDYDTNARIQSAVLSSSGKELLVRNQPFGDMGILGPGDKIDLTFNVEVAEEVKDGTYPLELAIEGNSFNYNSRKNIPLEVDSSNIMVIPSKPLELRNGKATLEFDVANTHPNEFNSVSIRPEAEGLEFYPVDYFIGNMDPDELFTIEFEASLAAPVEPSFEPGKAKDEEGKLAAPSSSLSGPINLSLTASYSNGINRHENSVSNLQLSQVSISKESSSIPLFVGFGLIGLILAGIFIYRKKKKRQN